MKTVTLTVGIHSPFSEGVFFAKSTDGSHWNIFFHATGQDAAAPFESLPWILAANRDEMERTWKSWIAEKYGTKENPINREA